MRAGASGLRAGVAAPRGSRGLGVGGGPAAAAVNAGAPWGPAGGLALGRCGADGVASLPEGPPYAPRGPG